MQARYKVFLNEVPITLASYLPDSDAYQISKLKKSSINSVVENVLNDRSARYWLHAKNPKSLKKQFKKWAPIIRAGGGLVYNDKGHVMMIYRNGKWDLAKGKLDKGEKIKACAIREVEEETGAKGLTLDQKICDTYHIFKRNGIYRVKRSTWYTMHTSDSSELIPQLEEGITKVQWVKPKNVAEKLKQSYPAIREVFLAASALSDK